MNITKCLFRWLWPKKALPQITDVWTVWFKPFGQTHCVRIGLIAHAFRYEGPEPDTTPSLRARSLCFQMGRLLGPSAIMESFKERFGEVLKSGDLLVRDRNGKGIVLRRAILTSIGSMVASQDLRVWEGVEGIYLEASEPDDTWDEVPL